MSKIYKLNKQNKMMILVRGIQGSGKSTFAEKMKQYGFNHYENDQYFTNEKGEYNFDITKHQQAKDETIKIVLEDVKKGKNIVVSNTFNSLKELGIYEEMAIKNGYHVEIVKMDLNFKSVHNIPEEVIEKAKKTYEPHNKETIISDEKYLVKLNNSVKFKPKYN